MVGEELREFCAANTINVIHPYCEAGIWAFDDKDKGLCAEPFISGVPEIIQLVTTKESITEPEDGFTLLFSATPFPGHQAVLRHFQSDGPPPTGGNWYRLEGGDLEGWLCPALYCYFDAPPEAIYLQVKNLYPGARRPSVLLARKRRQQAQQ